MTTREKSRSDVRVWAYCGGLFVVGSLLAVVVGLTADPPVGQPFQIPWPVFAVAFVVAEWLAVDVEVKREAQTLTFTEAPITLGLLLADPGEFILVRVVVAATAIAIIRRSPFIKLVFNTGLFALQIAAAVLVFHVVLGSASAIEPIGWVAAMLAATTSYVISAVAVTAVMALAGAPVKLESQALFVGVGLLAALAGAAVSLGAATALWRDGRSWVLLVVIGAAIGYFFVSFLRIRERHQSLATLHEFTTRLSRAETPMALGEEVVIGVAELLRAHRVVVLVPSDADVARIEYVDGVVTTEPQHDVTDLEWATAVGTAGGSHRMDSLAGVDLSDASVSVRLPLPDRPGLILVDGRLASTRTFDGEDIQLLETAAGHAATAFHNAQLVKELREEADYRARQALRDEITDLPNSRGLVENLTRPLATGVRLAVLTVRADSLREVNETLGRSMGDELLTRIAARLSPLVADRAGSGHWCAKTASDEFTLAVTGGRREAEIIADRISELFDEPIQCGDVALAVSVGIGVAIAPEHGSETEILLRRASLAASRCRIEGTKVTTWAADRDPYDPQRLAIAADLRDAIARNELQVHFHPQVDLASGRVTGAEALVRWNHPRLGELSPDQFIPAAEYTGAVDALTIHILEEAATTCARWRAQGWDLEIGVNISARNLSNPRFAGQVREVLEEAGLDPVALTLELTESSVMTEAEPAIATLHELHRSGISISVDDFGTGYSSLAHLRRLPVSEIKIDKSFVVDMIGNGSDEAIVRSLIDLGHNLSMTVVVEGVETPEVRRRLAELGADRIQGFLLCRPMSATAFEAWIADRPVRMAEMADATQIAEIIDTTDQDLHTKGQG